MFLLNPHIVGQLGCTLSKSKHKLWKFIETLRAECFSFWELKRADRQTLQRFYLYRFKQTINLDVETLSSLDGTWQLSSDYVCIHRPRRNHCWHDVCFLSAIADNVDACKHRRSLSRGWGVGGGGLIFHARVRRNRRELRLNCCYLRVLQHCVIIINWKRMMRIDVGMEQPCLKRPHHVINISFHFITIGTWRDIITSVKLSRR